MQDMRGLVLIVGLLSAGVAAQDPSAVIADLMRVEEAAKEVAEIARKTTVALKSGPGHGSGVIVTEDGFVLTAAHCTRKPGDEVTVVLPDGREVKGRTLGREELHDFGLVKIVEPGPYVHAEMGFSKAVPRNAFCFATGNPWKIQKPVPLRLGTIIKTNEHTGRYIRSTCKVAPGDSGGPLWNLDGQVIGIHSFISPSTRHNYHVPIDRYRKNWDRLLKGDQWNLRPKSGGPKRPGEGSDEDKRNDRGAGEPDASKPFVKPPERGACDFGIEVAGVAGAGGCRVIKIRPEGPGAAAGLVVGDVITRIAKRSILTERSLHLARRRSREGVPIKVTVRRGSADVELELIPGAAR